MDKEIFQKLLDVAGLTKKQLSKISGIPYPTIRGWGSTTPFPPYLKFMLENYIKAKSYESMRDQVFRIEKIK